MSLSYKTRFFDSLSNTQQRVLSALIILGIVITLALLGSTYVLVLALVAGSIIVDEFFKNFVNKSRSQISYFFSQALFICPFFYFNFINPSDFAYNAFLWLGIIIDIYLWYYLFFTPLAKVSAESKLLFERFFYFFGLLVLAPCMAIASLAQYESFNTLLAGLLIINFSADTGAWFFGRKYGKRKLWEKVSPKKTIEGLIGGIFTSMLLGGLFWYFSFGQINLILLICISLIALFSSIGDLVQSKIKREFGVKDSSTLIPGHGGVYDRVDSLLFIAPFYCFFVHYFWA